MNIPTVHRFYPCVVTSNKDSEVFCWDYFTPYCFIQGGNVPKPIEKNDVNIKCTVEVLEYPDGRYSAAWFPGRFRE